MKTTAFGMILVLGVLLGLGTSGFAIYYVDGGNGDDANDGAGWGTAWKTVTNALTQAVAPSEIWVKAGTYYPTTDGDRTKSITMKDGVDLYGGFAGTEVSRGERNWSNNATVFSGDIGTVGVTTDNSYHVVTGATARIDGFVIQDGRADGGTPALTSGGGMYTVGAFPITANCIFSNNQAGSGNYSGGGGVYWGQGAYTSCTVGWYNCTFDANVAYSPAASIYGGGLYASFMTNTVGAISNCTFMNNIVTGYYAMASALYLRDDGMQIWPEGSAFEIANCVFSNNATRNEYYGGAVVAEQFVAPIIFKDCLFVTNNATSAGALTVINFASGTGVQMTRCVFDGNRANGSIASGTAGVGGAVRFITSGGTNSFWRNCVFKNNVATYGGGAIYGALDGTFDTCDFVSNFCSSYGAAIYSATGFGSVTNDIFTNCTFTANFSSAGNGNAAYLDVPATFLACAFNNNSVQNGATDGNGGAIYVATPSGTTVVSQCTFTSNQTALLYPGGSGGAILHLGTGSLTIMNSVFAQNITFNYGGAVFSSGAATTLASDCTFVSNRTTTYGGGAWASSTTTGSSRVLRSVFEGNSASTFYGGGIYFGPLSGDMTGLVANCVFRDNRATYGGAIAALNASVIVSNVTAYSNVALTAANGGAFCHTAASGHSSLVVNSIFWNNSSPAIGPEAGLPGVTVNYSCVQGGFTGTGNISVDPLFAESTYLHEQSKYGYFDGGYFTGGTWLAATNNSPAIDAGDPTSDWSLEPIANGGRINMGAYGDTTVASKSKLINAGLILQIQ